MDGFTALRVQVLGEVSAWRGGDPIALGPASRRAVLGLLALAGGQPLGRIELLAGVWNGRPPPPTAVNVLQSAADEGRDTETVATGVDTVDLPRSARPLARPGRQPARRGRGGRAMMHCRAALYKMEGVGSAPIWDSLGYSQLKLGRHAEAVDCFTRSAALYRALGDRHIEVIVLTHLAEAHQARGAVRAARRVWRRSLAILGDLDPSVAQGIRTALKNTNRD